MSDLQAHARRTDPPPSHQAAAAMKPSLRPLEELLLVEFKSVGSQGFTSFELAEFTGIPHVTVSSRLKPMEEAGVLIRTDERRTGPSGRSSTVWRAA